MRGGYRETSELRTIPASTDLKNYDVAIIGGGAAGLSAAQYAARANLSTLVLEREASGGQCNLISELENYPGFPEPIDGEEFSERFEEQAKRFGAEIEFGDVEAIDRAGDRYLEFSNTGTRSSTGR